MATNPRIPSNNEVTDRREMGPKLVPGQPTPQRPGSSVPGVLAAIVVAIALIAAIVYYMPRAPRKSLPPSAAEIPTQPSGSQLQFSGMRITLAPTGGALNLDGQVMNTGDRPIIGSMVRLAFRNAAGTIVGTATAPLEGMTNKGQTLVRDDFSSDPLKPNITRPFRVSASRIPSGWNHTMPEMTVLTVSAEGK
jgi:hypothetical protein